MEVHGFCVPFDGLYSRTQEAMNIGKVCTGHLEWKFQCCMQDASVICSAKVPIVGTCLCTVIDKTPKQKGYFVHSRQLHQIVLLVWVTIG